MASCRKFRSLIDLYLDGEADDRQKHTLISHMEGCKECRERVEEVRNLHAAIKSVPRATLPASFRGKLLGRIRTMETGRDRHPHLLIAIGCTAVVLLIVGFAWRMTRDPGDILAVPEIHIVSPREDAIVEREYVDISVAYDPGEARNIRVRRRRLAVTIISSSTPASASTDCASATGASLPANAPPMATNSGFLMKVLDVFMLFFSPCSASKTCYKVIVLLKPTVDPDWHSLLVQ